MSEFKLKADCIFEADSVDDALVRLARHFLELYTDGIDKSDPVVMLEGGIEIMKVKPSPVEGEEAPS